MNKKIENNPLCKIRKIYRAIDEYENKIVHDYGLSLNEGMLLCCIQEYGKTSSTDIAKSLGLTCSNASKVIKSVETKKFIKRTIGNKDKRVMLFSITEEGENKINAVISDTKDMPAIIKELEI